MKNKVITIRYGQDALAHLGYKPPFVAGEIIREVLATGKSYSPSQTALIEREKRPSVRDTAVAIATGAAAGAVSGFGVAAIGTVILGGATGGAAEGVDQVTRTPITRTSPRPQ